MPDTYAPLTSPSAGNGSAYIGNAVRASWGEQARQNFNVLAHPHTHDLGGSDDVAIESASWVAVRGSKPIQLCADDFAGLTVDLVAFYRTLAAGGSVQVRLYNVDDAAVVGTGAVSTSTTRTREVITLTLPTGATPKWCELQVQGGDAAIGVFGDGYVRVRG